MERSSREASGLQSAILLFGAALYKRGAITRAERRRCEPRRPHHTVDAAAARTLPRERDRSTPSTTHRQVEGTMGAADDATRPTGDDDAAMVSPVVLAQRTPGPCTTKPSGRHAARRRGAVLRRQAQ